MRQSCLNIASFRRVVFIEQICLWCTAFVLNLQYVQYWFWEVAFLSVAVLGINIGDVLHKSATFLHIQEQAITPANRSGLFPIDLYASQWERALPCWSISPVNRRSRSAFELICQPITESPSLLIYFAANRRSHSAFELIPWPIGDPAALMSSLPANRSKPNPVDLFCQPMRDYVPLISSFASQ